MAPPRPGVAALAALLVLSARRKTQRARQATPSGFLGDDAGFTEGARGVVAGLLLTGSDFGFVTLLGIISLSGIVINNAIVLIDRIRIEIDDNGPAPREAVLAAARARLRPILLTTATTIGGLMPMWLGGGPMWEPMAISIIFGLAFATVLTLGLVPVLYSLLFGVSFRDAGAGEVADAGPRRGPHGRVALTRGPPAP